ncbi:uncharacterized protein [Dysidea avara]|uniref:uncharacterized protein isoform X2 n=1 Tax=Dysidea avara TaxID=196820 RepID=UPI0033190DA3
MYHLQVGCILVTYHKDQQVDLSDLIKTAAMLCEDCNPIGVRQDVVNFIRATLNVEYFSYSMMCYNDMFEIMCCHDMKRDIIQRDYEAEEMKILLRFLQGVMEFTFEEHKRVEEYFSVVKMPIQLHIGPFLCHYGISLCDPDYDYDLSLNKIVYLMNEIFKSTVDRHQLTEYISQVMINVKIDEEKVDKHIKELTSETPTTIDVKSEVRRVKASLLKASLDQKLTISNKILTITRDRQLKQAMFDIYKQEALVSDKPMTGKSKEPKLPEEKVDAPQNPQPDPNPRRTLRGVWSQDKTAQMVHLVQEYNHRITQNLAFLSATFMIQARVEDWCQLKIVAERYAKTFEDEWPDTVSKIKSGGKRHRRYSHPPPEEVLEESRQVIKMLKSSTKLN